MGCLFSTEEEVCFAANDSKIDLRYQDAYTDEYAKAIEIFYSLPEGSELPNWVVKTIFGYVPSEPIPIKKNTKPRLYI
jgi:hypothetical protein